MTTIESYMLLRDEWQEMNEGPVKEALSKALTILFREIRSFVGKFENETTADWAERTGRAGLEVHTCPHCQKKTFVGSGSREDVFGKQATCDVCGTEFMATGTTISHVNYIRCSNTGFTLKYE